MSLCVCVRLGVTFTLIFIINYYYMYCGPLLGFPNGQRGYLQQCFRQG